MSMILFFEIRVFFFMFQLFEFCFVGNRDMIFDMVVVEVVLPHALQNPGKAAEDR